VQQPSTAPSHSTMRLNPVALAIAFGVAGVVEVILFGVVMGAMWGMMGGGAMHGSVGSGPGNCRGWMTGGGIGPGYGGRGMMCGGVCFFGHALFLGFHGGDVARDTLAWRRIAGGINTPEHGRLEIAAAARGSDLAPRRDGGAGAPVSRCPQRIPGTTRRVPSGVGKIYSSPGPSTVRRDLPVRRTCGVCA